MHIALGCDLSVDAMEKVRRLIERSVAAGPGRLVLGGQRARVRPPFPCGLAWVGITALISTSS